ncbi:hypothetical protein CANARDRAFT_202802 [[Candida] arabinofermentans NRRL YB-2248]|uniref:Endonuclease III homolog n=1 Tax=[Candida] arabinofermentans NRRL YB-2248 TaxID=983967 RepID=A0A1E4SVP7_9ASCO|nr:hypothetical protein CANARDRAFT_202802 [[Candida] arabinofermentans NRRL YB-2248]
MLTILRNSRPRLSRVSFVVSRFNSTEQIDDDNENSITNRREWLCFNKPTDESRSFTISSYNLLSRHYMWSQVYDYLPAKSIDWDNRFELINKNMKDLAEISDIMCFQEMEYKVYNDYWKDYLLERNFTSQIKMKRSPNYWTKNPTMMDGVSIFVNQDKFKVINYEKIDYADNIFNNPMLFEQTEDLKNRLCNRNTVAVVVTLQHLITKELIFLSNTHLYWSPKHPDVKLLQTYALTKAIKNSIQRYYKIDSDLEMNEFLIKNNVNIFMVGDFNSVPDSLVYKFLTKGEIDLSNEPEFNQDYGKTIPKTILKNDLGEFNSPYRSPFESHLFDKTTYTRNFKQIIDYIWFNKSNKNLKLISALGDLDKSYLDRYLGFPNEEFPKNELAGFIKHEEQEYDFTTQTQTPSPSPPRKKVKMEVKIEESDLLNDSNVKIKRKVKQKQKQKPKQQVNLPTTVPDTFWKVYPLIKKMRSNIISPVDTMGCATSTTQITGLTKGVNYRFQTLISLMMSSQTKDEVNHATLLKLHEFCQNELGFTNDGLCIDAILKINDLDLDNVIKSVGFHNRKTQYIKKAAIMLKEKFNSDIPKDINSIMELPGVGPKMGYLLLQIAWGITTGIGVDVHVDRICRMFKWVRGPGGGGPEYTRKCLESMFSKPEDKYLWNELNPVLVGFGQVVCTPVRPRCDLCLVSRTGLCPGVDKPLVRKSDSDRLKGVSDWWCIGKSRGDLNLLVKDIEDLY